MSGKNIISRLDFGNETFQKTFRKLKPKQQKEAHTAFGLMAMMDTDAAPGKLHFHPLTNVKVPSVADPKVKIKVYTIHITADDTYKASFTLENGTAHMRVCGEHDDVDDNP